MANFVLPKASGNGIFVDTAAPTFPWHDILGHPMIMTTGPTAPVFTTYNGTISEHRFKAGDVMNFEYHIPHDYALGTDLFIHYHWSHNFTTVTGGTVTWSVDSSYAKGHNQAAFSAPGTVATSPTASTTQYQHMLSEVQLSAASPTGGQLTTGDIEPDGIILATVSLTANNITVSSGLVPDPFLHFADIHYQSTNVGTKQKAPNFYV